MGGQGTESAHSSGGFTHFFVVDYGIGFRSVIINSDIAFLRSDFVFSVRLSELFQSVERICFVFLYVELFCFLQPTVVGR